MVNRFMGAGMPEGGSSAGLKLMAAVTVVLAFLVAFIFLNSNNPSVGMALFTVPL